MSATLTPETSAPAVVVAGAEFRTIPFALLRESALNTRKHFDPVKLEELAESIRKSGILTPLLVRPHGRQYEIAAGHRRFRGGKLAGLNGAPCIIREMDDRTFLEVLTIENLQREDVHPLEEADGFSSLMKSAGYDVAKIAERIGRSTHYVYDRLRFLGLTDAAKELFYANRFSAAHAVLLARLSPEDQARAIGDPEDLRGGLFVGEQIEWGPDDAELDIPDDRKPVSVREFQGWINKHVRFDPTAEDVPQLFPETAVVVRQAAEEEEKVVKITHEHYVQPEARAEDERTISPRSWKRADGKHDSKTCDYSVVGVVAIGPGRGEAFRVCLDKKKCQVHWAAEMKEAAQRAKSPSSTNGHSATDERWRQQEQKRKAEEEKTRADRARWVKARPELLKAFAGAVKKAKLGTIVDLVLEQFDSDRGFTKKRAEELVPQGATAESVLRHLAMLHIGSEAANEFWMERTLTPLGKQFGVNVKTIVDDVAPAPQAEKAKKPAAKKKASAKKAKRT